MFNTLKALTKNQIFSILKIIKNNLSLKFAIKNRYKIDLGKNTTNNRD